MYFRPDAGHDNAGYILLDLDRPAPGILTCLRAQGHQPSVVVETSPGRLQAWIQVSRLPLPSTLATRISRRLAQLYGADLGSAEGRHLGRLAGFTNRKSHRLKGDGLAPWVKLIYARQGLAPGGAALIKLAAQLPAGASVGDPPVPPHASDWVVPTPALDSTALPTLYQTYLHRWRILERYPSPDWRIVDKWIARELLQAGYPLAAIAADLRHGSPGFPRRHGDSEDYLRRTLRCAARQIRSSVFPAPFSPCSAAPD